MEPVNVPELAVNFAELDNVAVPAEREPTVNCAPVRLREPPLSVPKEPVDVAVACPSFSVPTITRFDAVTEPPLSVGICRLPLPAEIAPAFTALLIVALLAKLVVPNPLRLLKVMVPVFAVKLAMLLLDNVPKVRPLPETSNCPALTVSKEFCE
jgi:hypothetical protein